MLNLPSTIDRMAGKEPQSGRGRPKGRKPTETIYARVEPELAEALRRHVETLRPTVKITALVAMIVEDYLRAQGAYPLADDDNTE